MAKTKKLGSAIAESESTKGFSALSRRGFTAGGLAAGFALAVQPLSASTIITSSEGLMAGEFAVPVADGTMKAYRAMPTGKGPFPIVIVVHEIFGVHEHIRDLCRRLANSGYYALAPQLFARQGDVENAPNIEAIRPITAKVPDAQVMADLDAAVIFAGKDGGDGKRLAITGFCWGGRVVWLYAAHNPNVDAGAAWYGRLTNETSERQPVHPYDVAEKLTVPVLGLYGGKDKGISLDTVEEMRKRLAKSKSKSQIIVYDEAEHAFNADYRPSYNETAAKDAWARMLAWFKAQGVA
jgi:carboxymethylenebutenolidase